MKTLQQNHLIYTISDIQKLCTPIFLEWEIKKAFLFGSYARNEATETSDIDILIDGEGALLHNIFDVIRLLDQYRMGSMKGMKARYEN
ncbi:nucleotidyltransferase family protein [Enterococcus faecalis]